ncbi:SH3 domain-binding protein 2 isoform X1 [Arapaima gigas]
MAVLVKKKKSFLLQNQPSIRMCFQDWDTKNMASAPMSWPTPMKAIGAQNLLTMPGGVSHSGYLHKKGGSQFSLMKWPLRFIILHKGCVYYFKSSTSPTPQGAFSLNGYNRVMRATEETTSSNVFPFKIVHFSKRHRTWYFSAACEEERKKWMLDLRKEIDYYHDRRESNFPSDSEADPDGFYGSIERPLDISYAPDNTDDDYVEDDEEDEDDYLEPDESPPLIGQPTVPPPAYPPPPVPFQHSKANPKPEPSSNSFKCLPPPVVPAPSKSPPPSTAHPRKSPPPLPPSKLCKIDPPNLKEISKGPPPPLPFAPHRQKPSSESFAAIPKSPNPIPLPPIVTQKKQASTVPSGWGRDTKPFGGVPSPATLPICNDLEKKLAMVALPRSCLSMPPASHQQLGKRHPEEQPKPVMYKPSTLPKPQPTEVHSKTRGPSLQRSPPDGQSFRSTADEALAHLRKGIPKRDSDSDEDYENVQLPDSVFIDTTETSCIEKLFRETDRSPQDGLYCIRNSGTKTSKVLVVWDVGLNKARNYRLFEENSRIFLETDVTFPSLAALVEYYYLHPLPNHDTLCLQRPYGYTPPRNQQEPGQLPASLKQWPMI